LVYYSYGVSRRASLVVLSPEEVLLVYLSNKDAYHLAAIFLNISGNTVSIGEDVKIYDTASQVFAAEMISSDKVLVTFRDDDNLYYGTAIILNVYGGAVSVSEKVVFYNSRADAITSMALSSEKVLVTFADQHNSSYLSAIILTVSGTNISVGEKASFSSTISFSPYGDNNFIVSKLISPEKAVLLYPTNDDKGKAIVLTISDDKISFGKELTFNQSVSSYICASDVYQNKLIALYSDDGNSDYGTAQPLYIVD
uniref:hypothetical protein n=1 Tax=uncultured Desulfovibrio sp. TaxID=167968 RepID=UPI002603FA7F